MNLPIESLEHLQETLDIQGYEYVGREEEHGIELEENSPAFVSDESADIVDGERIEQNRYQKILETCSCLFQI